MIKTGWTTADKTELAEVLGRAAKWRGGAQFINFVGQFFDSVSELYAIDAEKTLLYEKAPDFSPLTPEELAEIQAARRPLPPRRGGRGGGGGGTAAPAALAARTAGRVLSRQEMFEETVYQPQQVLDVDAGRKMFEANCASCHKFGVGRQRPRRRRPEPVELAAARVEARAARSGVLPEPQARAGARNDGGRHRRDGKKIERAGA